MSVLKKFQKPLLLAVLVLIPFWDLLCLPAEQTIAGNDLDFMFLQWWRFGTASLRQGELPLWNPGLFSGVPFLANPQPALFYPPVWLLLAFPAAKVAAILLVLHLWLAGWGMYGWLRREGADEWGAFFGALVFAFNGYFAVRLFAGHLGVVMVQAWLPMILWAYHWALERGRLTAALLGGVPVALSLLGGHTASFLYVGLALAAYALYYAWEKWQAAGAPRAGLWPIVVAGVMVLAGLGLAAVQLLPTTEFLRLSTRQETSYAFAADHAWPPGYLLTLLIPNFFGRLGDIGYWGDGIYTELIYYAGVLPLFLALALGAAARARHHLRPFLLVLGGAGLFLALGPFNILHRLAFNFIPLFRVTRAPARAGFLFTFAVAALSGLLLTWLRQHFKAAGPALRRWTRGPGVWVVVSITSLVIVTAFFLFALQRESNPQVGRLWHVANQSALFLFLFLLTIGLMYAWGRGHLDARQGTSLAIGLVLLDLWGFGRSLIQPVPVQESAYWRTVAEISQTDEGTGRVLPWGLSIFEHNKGMAFGLESVFGYDPLELERYARLTTAVPDPRARAYDLLGARYLVSTQEMSFPSGPDAPQLIDQRVGVWVYERPTAYPAAWLVHQAEVHADDAMLERLNAPDFDPQRVVLLAQAPPCELSQSSAVSTAPLETVEFSRPGNNEVRIHVQAAAPGIVVMSEVFYPGWRATMDGRPVPLLRADYALRAVCVPPGEHVITLSFVPASLWVGAGITLVCLLLVGWAVWRERKVNLATRCVL